LARHHDAAGLVITNTGLGDLTYELVEQRGGFALSCDTPMAAG